MIAELSRDSQNVFDAKRAAYAVQASAELGQVLPAASLAQLAFGLDQLRFKAADYDGIGDEQSPVSISLERILDFVFSDPAFVESIEKITGAGPLSCFQGRIYRMLPGQSFSWHDDDFEDRVVGMSVNLTRGSFEGGTFEIRSCADGRVLNRIANTVCGHAFVFKVSKAFQHRVTPVLGQMPKLAYAGWFRN